jgi:N-acetylmuramic acid 6-phosphate etherase
MALRSEMAADQGLFIYQFHAVTRSTFKFMFEHLTTESRNPASEDLDSLSTGEIVRLINAEDAKVAAAVEQQNDAIARAVDAIADRLGKGGRLIYIGAGTSGRLGVLDAVECPPTFNTNPAQVVGVIAGGYSALTRAVEGAEDLPAMAIDDLKNLNVTAADVVVGIATSGRTPYVIGALDYARSTGAFTIGLSCNRDPELASRADVSIAPVVGPEVVSGSTRMKAGTATKMVLNILSTATMIRLGKTYGNLMVDLRATNSKLSDRARRIVRAVTQLTDIEAEKLLRSCNGEVKTAIVSHCAGTSSDEARQLLAGTNGHLRQALQLHAKHTSNGISAHHLSAASLAAPSAASIDAGNSHGGPTQFSG